MKLHKLLTVSGEPVKLVKETVQLDLFSTGRATFEVIAEFEPVGVVELFLGYNIDELTPYFLGVIESKQESNGSWLLTCRELIGALSFNHHFALRFPKLIDVLNAITNNGLEFTIPDAIYADTAAANFYHNGDGITALRQCGKVFSIPDFIFQQKTDGKIYVGSWQDSQWQKSPVTISQDLITKITATTAKMLATPKLRPGVMLNGKIIHQVTFSKSEMQILWFRKLLNE